MRPSASCEARCVHSLTQTHTHALLQHQIASRELELSAATQAFEIERGAKQELHSCKVEEADAFVDTPGFDTTNFTTSFTIS